MSSFYTPSNVRGADKQIQYNENGVLSASSDLTWDSSTKELGVAGHLLVGTSSARTDLIAGTRGGQVQIEAASADAASAIDNSSLCLTAGHSGDGPGSSNIFLTRTKSNSLGGVALVADNDILGGFYFQGTDGTDAVPAALIKTEVDGTPAYAATALVNGQTYRIVTVGTTDFTLIGASANTVGTVFTATGPGTGTGTAILNAGNMPGRLVFSTTADGASLPTEACRIDSSQRLLVGTTTARGRITSEPATGDWGIGINDATSTTQSFAVFRYAGTNIGSITGNNTATAYSTSSDYRLKENVTAVTDGITRLQQLNPSRFNFIADPDKTVDGFLAHEVQAIVPEAITGEKDAVDEDGNPIYQGIDQSKLVPLLTAALQEAVAEINALKDRLTAAGI